MSLLLPQKASISFLRMVPSFHGSGTAAKMGFLKDEAYRYILPGEIGSGLA